MNEKMWSHVLIVYRYFGGSLAATAGTAVAAFRSPTMMNLVSRGGLMAMGVSIAAMIGSSMVARSIPYTPGVGAKQMAWLAHCAVIGCVIAPICLLGGPILTRAAWYTAGMVGGLSTVAVCAPSDKFLYMGGPLAMGLGKQCIIFKNIFLSQKHNDKAL